MRISGLPESAAIYFRRRALYTQLMRFWILSDLHIEQSRWDIPVPAPDYDVLIAAGDIHTPLSAGVRWLAERADGRPVIYVPGNHEWYAYQQRFTISDEGKRGQELADDAWYPLAARCRSRDRWRPVSRQQPLDRL